MQKVPGSKFQENIFCLFLVLLLVFGLWSVVYGLWSLVFGLFFPGVTIC